jgi:protoheme IX farnesyltransferase
MNRIPEIKALYQLFKPGLALSIVLTVLPALFSSTVMPDSATILGTITGTMLSAMSAFGYNQIVEQHRDAMMERTRHRILVTGQANPYTVYIVSSSLLGSGLLILIMYAGPLAMIFSLLSFLIYIFLYTIWLKPRSPLNTPAGGIAGAVGPLIGESAAKGHVTEYGWLLFLFLFLWQPPHFWALACYRKEDYARAGFAMLPVVRGIAHTSIQMILYQFLLTVLMMVSFYPLGYTDIPFALTAVPFSIFVLISMIRFARSQDLQHARTSFFLTIFHNLIWHGALTYEQLSRHYF